jgi:beta-glucanase (GH16 family)
MSTQARPAMYWQWFASTFTVPVEPAPGAVADQLDGTSAAVVVPVQGVLSRCQAGRACGRVTLPSRRYLVIVAFPHSPSRRPPVAPVAAESRLDLGSHPAHRLLGRNGVTARNGADLGGSDVTKLWKLLLGLAIVAAIVVWDVGLPGHDSAAPSRADAAASRALLPDPRPPALPGVLQPKGKPEFVADFSGSRLDKSVWDTCYPYDSQSGCQNFGNSTVEGEWYIPGQVHVSGGMLHLVAQRQPVLGQSSTGAPKEYGCRSGMITSYPGLDFEYGYLQIVAKIPANAGLWSALWLAASNFQWPPEMDIVEAWGTGPSQPLPFVSSTYFHWKTPTGEQYVGGPLSPLQRASGWHTFALSWTKTQITWLIDGVVVQTVRQHIPQQKMYVIADLAEEISPQHPTVEPGQCDGSMSIRSVTLWPAKA